MAEPEFGYCKAKNAIVSDYTCKRICKNKCKNRDGVEKWYPIPEDATIDFAEGLRARPREAHPKVQ